ncbi:unnamed protein product [Thlaspi arvense]|uniref:J domain-containing protein n=1 Tax=Thlaspi arvense TaxID=13288 RepID=A0AAU9T5K5_THLAR|nr:unnamed protein product [Thlaspi arvense]
MMQMYDESGLTRRRVEARRAKAVAVDKFKMGDLAGAKEYVVRAKNLNPLLCGLLCLNTVLDVLIGFGKKINGEVDWYAVLGVEPTADVETIKSRYNKLSTGIILENDKSVGSIVEASNILAESWRVLCNENKRKAYDRRRGIQQPVQRKRRVSNVFMGTNSSSSATTASAAASSLEDSSFWTTCGNCSFKHKYPKSYIGHTLVCVKCRQQFEAIGHPASSMSDVNPWSYEKQQNKRNIPSLSLSLSLADIPLTFSAPKPMAKPQSLVNYVSSSEQSNVGSFSLTKVPRRSKNTADMVKDKEEEPALRIMSVPIPHFYHFDNYRTESSFREDQVWAVFDNHDGMPRFYALVHGIVSQKPFTLRISWLESKNNEELGPMKWIDSGFYKTCGRFSIGRRCKYELLYSFSHRVQCTNGDNGFVQIYPERGDVWALYTNWSPSWGFSTPEEVVYKYEMV